jgi:hypothetical protein
MKTVKKSTQYENYMLYCVIVNPVTFCVGKIKRRTRGKYSVNFAKEKTKRRTGGNTRNETKKEKTNRGKNSE